MKSKLAFTALALLTFASTVSFAAGQTLSCVNVASSALKFGLTLDKNAEKISFNKASGSEAEEDISGRTVKLTFNEKDSARGYLQYDGTLIIDRANQKMRAIEIRIAKNELSKSANIRVLFAPSDAYYGDSGASTFDQYEMLCQRK